MNHGKKFRTSEKLVDPQQLHSLEEAVELVKKMAYAKFDETVELAMKLNVKANHSIRDTVVLPHSFRAEKKVLVFAKGEKADEARAAGLLSGEPTPEKPARGLSIDTGERDSDEAPPAKPLTRMNLAELREVCAAEDIDAEGLNLRAEFIDAIEYAREARIAAASPLDED